MSKPDPWTVQEGVQDVLRFLARRAPWALGIWLALFALVSLITRLGAVAGQLSWFAFMMAFLAAFVGVPVGAVFSRGLTDAVRFVGWIPVVLASLASWVVIGAGSALSHQVIALPDRHYLALLPIAACLGACGAVAKFAWAEA